HSRVFRSVRKEEVDEGAFRETPHHPLPQIHFLVSQWKTHNLLGYSPKIRSEFGVTQTLCG
ncbi:MAG: hypothetical protein NW224_18910, partial [Leptolyngbyaceae cyanobacterium bins.302]|nr:hypothetical protein [Leptolyngbyaceae cyanobacterium bins.302]